MKFRITLIKTNFFFVGYPLVEISLTPRFYSLSERNFFVNVINLSPTFVRVALTNAG
jgi:hypothetical protein